MAVDAECHTGFASVCGCFEEPIFGVVSPRGVLRSVAPTQLSTSNGTFTQACEDEEVARASRHEARPSRWTTHWNASVVILSLKCDRVSKFDARLPKATRSDVCVMGQEKISQVLQFGILRTARTKIVQEHCI